MPTVALANCKELPEPDPDEAPLLGALAERDIDARTAAWDDDSVDWSTFDLVLLRATWNYFVDRDKFIEWAEHVDQVSALRNRPEVVRWNTHKRYLLELSRAEVSTVPTELCDRGSVGSLAALRQRRGWDRIVVKPAVSAGSYLTFSMRSDSADDDAKFRGLVAERDMLVQPFIDSVADYGERSIVVIDGEQTHAVRKSPRFGGDVEVVTGPFDIEPAEAALARAALAAAPVEDLLYARVDMARDERGEPMVTELELCEPSLFFRFSQRALDRLADRVARAVRDRR